MSTSADGSATASVPPSVARLRTCRDATVRAAAASTGRRSSSPSITRLHVTPAPRRRTSPSATAANPATRETSSSGPGRSPRLRAGITSVPPATTTAPGTSLAGTQRRVQGLGLEDLHRAVPYSGLDGDVRERVHVDQAAVGQAQLRDHGQRDEGELHERLLDRRAERVRGGRAEDAQLLGDLSGR